MEMVEEKVLGKGVKMNMPSVYPLLEIRRATKAFGGIDAVQNFDLKVEKENIYAIIGPNGSGKTTLINLISGLLEPTSGVFFFRGIDLKDFRPDQRTAMGISRTFQNIRVFSQMSVLENVMMARHCTAFG
jgi:branched-chain amino acid transport system ATP-binding protein